MSRFTQLLTVSPLDDGRRWAIISDFGYDIGHENSGCTVNVPQGFVTDFASIPFWLSFGQLRPWGMHGNAAVIHDWLYWQQATTRKHADQIFLEAMTVLQVGCITKYILYFGVRWFGWWAWDFKIPARKRLGDTGMINIAASKSSAQSGRTGSIAATREILRSLWR